MISRNIKKVLFAILCGISFIAILSSQSIGEANQQYLVQSPVIESPVESPNPISSPQTGQNLFQVLSSNSSFTTLTSAIQTAGLADTLSGELSYTLFAPTKEAFAALPKKTFRKLLQAQNQGVLAKILTYHLIVGETTANQFQSGELPTVEGDSLTVKVNANHRITVNQARVAPESLSASNGIIYAINKVLVPPGVKLSNLN